MFFGLTGRSADLGLEGNAASTNVPDVQKQKAKSDDRALDFQLDVKTTQISADVFWLSAADVMDDKTTHANAATSWSETSVVSIQTTFSVRTFIYL